MASRNSCSSSSFSRLHVHDRAVVALHELLDRQRVGGVLVAEGLRELDLVIEQQPVLAPPGERRAARSAPSTGTPAPASGGAAPRAVRKPCVTSPSSDVGAEVALGDPGDGLDVAQPARAGLDVRLEVVGGVVGLQVPLASARAPWPRRTRFTGQMRSGASAVRIAASSCRVAGQQPRLDAASS